MPQSTHITRHARRRMDQRAIPEKIVALILDFGDSRAVRNGALTFWLSRESLRAIRHVFGRGTVRALDHFRRAYVVVASGVVVTAAFANQPRFS